MNKQTNTVLFLSLSNMSSIDENGIYIDLMRTFHRQGWTVYSVVPSMHKNEVIHTVDGFTIIKVKTGKIQKSNIIRKGLATLSISHAYINAIRKHCNKVKFNLVLYPTPPITLVDVVKWVKKRDNAQTYLMLKDIFPQNAVDIGMMSTKGIKKVLYKYFRNKEQKLYNISDRIGCMSKANVKYVLKNNVTIAESKLDICPNCMDVQDVLISDEEIKKLRQKYGIPLNKKIFVYGGNLGRPQCIPFIIKCIKVCGSITDAFFLIVGDGTEYGKIEQYVKTENPTNIRLIKRLPKEEYDHMIAACDVGLLFLDYRFTIPNFPSRLLSYMQAGLPVIAATDTVTDVGKTIVDGGFGWWCESNSEMEFRKIVKLILEDDIRKKGKMSFEYLIKEYTTDKAYETIIKRI